MLICSNGERVGQKAPNDFDVSPRRRAARHAKACDNFRIGREIELCNVGLGHKDLASQGEGEHENHRPDHLGLQGGFAC